LLVASARVCHANCANPKDDLSWPVLLRKITSPALVSSRLPSFLVRSQVIELIFIPSHSRGCAASFAPRSRPALTSSFASSPAMDPENPPPPSGSPTAADLCRPQRIGSPTRPKFRTCDTVLKNTEEMEHLHQERRAALPVSCPQQIGEPTSRRLATCHKEEKERLSSSRSCREETLDRSR